MSRREIKKFSMYDRNTPDYAMFNVWDSEIIEIASPPLYVYQFDLTASIKGKLSAIDPVYNEVDVFDEAEMESLYRKGFSGNMDPNIIRDGEQFKVPIETKGYYQEAIWTQELSRIGIDEPEELSITLNYHSMLADLRREIGIGDVIRTFRNKVYRVMDAYIADETVGWNYIHFHVVAKKPKDLDRLILPDHPNIPQWSSAGQ
jgi:hypothetical protein